MRVTYVSELNVQGDDAGYHLPLADANAAAPIELRVEVVQAPVEPVLSEGLGNLALTRFEERWVAEATLPRGLAGDDLQIDHRGLPGQPLLHQRAEAIEPPAVLRERDLLLAREVAKERPAPDAGGRGDVLDAHALEPAGLEQRARGRDEGVAGLLPSPRVTAGRRLAHGELRRRGDPLTSDTECHNVARSREAQAFGRRELGEGRARCGDEHWRC